VPIKQEISVLDGVAFGKLVGGTAAMGTDELSSCGTAGWMTSSSGAWSVGGRYRNLFL